LKGSEQGLFDITHTSRSCISWWTHRRELRLFEETPLSVSGRMTISCSEHRFLETSVFSKRPLERRLCFHRRSSWVIAICDYCNSLSLNIADHFHCFFWTKILAHKVREKQYQNWIRDSNRICVGSNFISILQEPGGGECL